MSINYILTDKSVTFMIGTNPHQVSRESVTFGDVIAELAKVDPDPVKLVELATPVIKIEREVRIAFDQAPTTQNYLAKRTVEVTRAGVLLDGVPMAGVLVDRMMEMLGLGLPLGGMIRFMENLYMNPAEFARDELYLWLENSDLPITDDGHFLAYKYVNADFRDCYSGKFDNSPGQIVQMKGRHEVDPVRDHTCSTGLHFCSKSYLASGGYTMGPKTVLLKINPADVVSIPSDYDNAKGRTWRYEVLREVTENIEGIKWAPLVANDGGDYSEFDENGKLEYEDINSSTVTIETDEDGDFYVFVEGEFGEADAFVRGSLVDAKLKAKELSDDLPLEPEPEEEDDPNDDADYSGSVRRDFKTAEGFEALIEGPDEDGKYYWWVGTLNDGCQYVDHDGFGFAETEASAEEAVAISSAELQRRGQG